MVKIIIDGIEIETERCNLKVSHEVSCFEELDYESSLLNDRDYCNTTPSQIKANLSELYNGIF